MFKYLSSYSESIPSYVSYALYTIVVIAALGSMVYQWFHIYRYIDNVKTKTKTRYSFAAEGWVPYVAFFGFIAVSIAMVSLGAIDTDLESSAILEATALPMGYLNWLKMSFTSPIDISIIASMTIVFAVSVVMGVKYRKYNYQAHMHNRGLEKAASEKQELVDSQLAELRSFVLREHSLKPLKYSETLIKTLNHIKVPMVELQHFLAFKSIDEVIEAFPDNLSNNLNDDVDVIPIMDINGEVDYDENEYTTEHVEDVTNQMLHDCLACHGIKSIIYSYEVQKVGTRKVARKVPSGKASSSSYTGFFGDVKHDTKVHMKTVYEDEEYIYTETETKVYAVNGSVTARNNAKKHHETLMSAVNESTPIRFKLESLSLYEIFGFATSYEQFEEATNKISTANNERMELLQAKI